MNYPCVHHILDREKNEFFLFTLYIHKASSILGLQVTNMDSNEMRSGFFYSAGLNESGFTIATNAHGLKCAISLFIGPETLLYSNSLNEPSRINNSEILSNYYDLIIFSAIDNFIQTLTEHPNDTLILICRIIFPLNDLYINSLESPIDSSTDCLTYMRKLAVDLQNSPGSLKEKVSLRADGEIETVSKAVLCARSPVFAEMFQNPTRELRDNTIHITDIKMPVLKVLLNFLYTGQLDSFALDFKPSFDSDFVCNLYTAAVKYKIAELRRLCVDILLPHISGENLFQVLKLAFTHKDERLKSAVSTMINANIETFVSSIEWKYLLEDELNVALEILNFFQF